MAFRPSATGNYAQAGRAVANDAARAFDAARTYSPKSDEIVRHAANLQAKENINLIKAEANLRKQGIGEKAKTAVQEMGLEAKQELQGAKRKAGMLAAAGKFLGTGIGGLAPSNRKKREVGTNDEYYTKRIDKYRSDIEELKNTPLPTFDTPTNTGAGSTSTSSFSSNTSGTDLTGARKELADAIAGPESGSYGYQAFNQGGADGGTRVLGKSGSHKELMGRDLTDMTLSEIFQKQNLGGSRAEFEAAGGLHAVGRYQFIGPPLQEEVKLMGLDPNTTKFTPQVQDDIFFSHIKRIGNISPWIGPSVNYDASKKAHLNNLIQQI